MNKKLR